MGCMNRFIHTGIARGMPGVSGARHARPENRDITREGYIMLRMCHEC